MKDTEPRCSMLLSYLLILGVALLRLEVAHPNNVIPVFSCLLFFVATRPAREFVLPLSVLVGADIFLTTQRYGYALTANQAVTWAWYLAAMILGVVMLRDSISTPRVIGASLMTSVSFFMASNFAVWVAWGIYPRTLGGLGTCYIAALPSFRNSIASETVFSLLIFSLARDSGAFMPALRLRRACS